MNVEDAMTPRSELVVVELPGTRDDALTYIQEHGFSSVPVVKREGGDEVYRGIVTRDDLISKPEEDQLALLMREVPTVTPEDTLVDAASLMVEKGARRLPVVASEGRGLEGILTVTDVIHAIARGHEDGDTEVGELATRDVNATYVGTPLPTVERELGLARVPYAVCLDDHGVMAGIVTEVDILEVARVVEGEESTGNSFADQDADYAWEGIKGTGNRYLPTRNVEIPAAPVSEFMSEDVVTVSKRRTAREAAQEMITNDIEQIPLVSGGELAGIVRDVDLLEAL
ncbi:MAG: CBS domain-containing protein [Haloferacaceae archaeon]